MSTDLRFLSYSVYSSLNPLTNFLLRAESKEIMKKKGFLAEEQNLPCPVRLSRCAYVCDHHKWPPLCLSLECRRIDRNRLRRKGTFAP